ncbi:hypothetical protein [Alkalimonas sp.]|uniref:hypothetical protein n=1 Tax=Alkalimonas sp. TaxID=1872453 RepID=UPI00263AE927|nr:hypothetical protein [Alkalimonas sp.]
MDTHENWSHQITLALLCEQLKIGTEQLARGEGIAVTSKTTLDDLFDDIKR